jgi:hypothetical protein
MVHADLGRTGKLGKLGRLRRLGRLGISKNLASKKVSVANLKGQRNAPNFTND